ncbi:MAG: pilus assembly protein [Burkholderiales bacterium]|nr:pilus assembly protein [Burkholderiales bacterium]
MTMPARSRHGPRSRGARAAAGQSIVEYLIILPTLLLLLLSAVQFGLLYQVKSQLNYATFNAVRTGALKNGSMTSMKDSLAAGLSPLFTHKPGLEGMLRGRLVGTIEVFNPMVTKVTVLNPTSTMFDAHKAADPRGSGKQQIPNDNLQYRPTTVKGGVNIQDANILKIRVTYCAKLVVPIANVVFYTLVSGADDISNVMGGKIYQNPNPALPVNTTCKGLHNLYGGKIIGALGTVDTYLGTDMKNEAQKALDQVNEILKTNIPFINWNLGGYRIPITSEAVVRMQTPYR